MLLALSGITGVGKSYFTQLVEDKLGFKKVNTIRTRNKRPGEEDGKTGLFKTKEEVEELKKEGKIIYDFDVFGGTYAYLKDEILSEDDYIFEMYYATINDFKKIRKDLVSIYIMPTDINKALEQIGKRNFSKEKEEERLKETKQQYEAFMNNKDIRDSFDYIIYNNYDEESKNNVIDLINKIKSKNNFR